MENKLDRIKKKLGFGCMRLPTVEGRIDLVAFGRMVDMFLSSGFNYFDTARGYHGGQSEGALRECLTKRHPRESYIFANKLSNPYFECEADIRPLFEDQLRECGLEYFDVYLMHAQNAKSFEKYKACRAYETAFELKAEGKIGHVGLSFHDTADVLDRILTEYPQLEVVQIQFNYVDYEDPNVQARLCYEVCRRHGKPVIIMEPVKGGSLVRLTDDARGVLEALGGGSVASYAIRYAAGFEGVAAVLSGMSDFEQLADNMSYMSDFRPLDQREREAVAEATRIFNGKKLISCTSCRYCVEGCPRRIPIPGIFSVINSGEQYKDYDTHGRYAARVKDRGRASDCVDCGLCEASCPQKLPIRQLLAHIGRKYD